MPTQNENLRKQKIVASFTSEIVAILHILTKKLFLEEIDDT